MAAADEGQRVRFFVDGIFIDGETISDRREGLQTAHTPSWKISRRDRHAMISNIYFWMESFVTQLMVFYLD